MQEHSFHKEGSDLGGSPEGRKDYASGQAEMGKPVRPEQVETYPADVKDSIVQSLSKNVLNMGNQIRALAKENARLKAEVEMLEGRVRYWKIEAECDHGRWLRCLEDLEHMRNLK